MKKKTQKVKAPGAESTPPGFEVVNPEVDEKTKFFGVFWDHQSRTCLRVDEQGQMTMFIPLEIEGFSVQRVRTSEFHLRYRPIRNYPVEKGVRQFLKYAQTYGSTAEVIEYLNRVIPINSTEADMATKKKAVAEKAAGTSGRKPGSGARIRELILEGKCTDTILEAIHKEFPGSKAKASDVAWNRGKLKRDGVKVPEMAKKEKPAKKEKATKKPAAAAKVKKAKAKKAAAAEA